MSETEPVAPKNCPECASGKCGNCNDLSWDDAIDGLALCPCYADGHPRRTA